MGWVRAAGATLVGTLVVSAPARAHPPDAEPDESEEPRPAWPAEMGPYHRRLPPEAEPGRADYTYVGKPGDYRHDGLYFRFAGGIGSGSNSAEAPNFRGAAGSVAFAASGSSVAGATEVALGAAVTPGLVLGGAIETVTLPSIETDSAAGVDERYELELTQLALFDLHLDVYPFAEYGLHGQLGFGFATLVVGQGFPKGAGPDSRAHTATGFGLMAGVGHEWWAAEQWGIGPMARLTYAWTDGVDVEGVSWSHRTWAVTLMLTTTYN